MKKFAKILPYLIILCCVIFLACMVIRTKERADALTNDLTRLAEENCDFLVSIPMRGKLNSLNASAAAAILLYEAVRQRS